MASTRRLMHELKAIQSEKTTDDVWLRCIDENGLLDWRASIRGPPDTPYADIFYELIISVPMDYPLKSPVVSFATKIFHPNVHFKVRKSGHTAPISMLVFAPESRRLTSTPLLFALKDR